MNARKIPVYVGPSLPAPFRPDGPFEWRPPARAGDLLALVERPPARLCLIDGYFGWHPAPWHKELLHLIARGTLMLGASSMGALRAAELHPFGMVGVGAIFRAYRDGRLEGDDEVALTHAGAELDWASLTVPMVELRATLAAACRAGLIAVPAARRIRGLAHDIHFEARDWPAIERACLAERLTDAAGSRRLRAMHVPLKRMDALACLRVALGPIPPTPSVPPPPATCFVDALARELGLSAPGPAPWPEPAPTR